MGQFDKKRIAVTGATGQIASTLIANILATNNNVKIFAIGRTEDKLNAVFSGLKKKYKITLIAADISQEFPDLGEIDYIFHAASPIAGKIIKTQPVNVILPNIMGTLNCLDYLKEQKEKKNKYGRLIVFSSATVYGNNNGRDVKVSESDTCIADSLTSLNIPYSESKRMIETLATSYWKQYGVDSVIARFSYLYGYSMIKPETAFFEFVDTAISKKNIVMNNSDIPRRDNIYIRDAVDGLITVAVKGISGEAYNISTSNSLDSFAAADEIAKVICAVANEINGTDISVEYSGEISETRRPGIMLNNTKLQELGWQPKWSLKEGVRETISLYLDGTGRSI